MMCLLLFRSVNSTRIFSCSIPFFSICFSCHYDDTPIFLTSSHIDVLYLAFIPTSINHFFSRHMERQKNLECIQLMTSVYRFGILFIKVRASDNLACVILDNLFHNFNLSIKRVSK